jgi:biopolymer transport protein ExbD
VKIRRTSGDSSDGINITSLLDVMFILIIFFLATTTFQQEERDIKVNLPESVEGKALSSVTKLLVINVRKNGTYLLGTEEVDVSALETKLAGAVESDPEQKVLVRGDREALHGHVAAAVAMCRRAGIREANIGYKTGR